MKNTRYPAYHAVAVAAAMALGSFGLNAAEPVTLTLGQTITLTGTADGAPTACTVVDPATVTCANLRSAVVHANNNGNEATAYDKIVLANGSTHTLSVARAGTEAIDGLDANAGDLDLTTPINIVTADGTLARATIQGGEGFGDRLLQVNAAVQLDNLVLTKGQGVFMNGGAIYAGDAGNTTITRSLITDNSATWDQVDGTGEAQGSGGGIYSKGVLSISQSTVSKNTAKTLRGDGTAEGDKIGNGGAIYASQATTIVDSTIGGAEAGNIAINGGGLQMAGGNKLEILRSTFSYNDSISGGGINVVSPAAAPFTITNSTFSTNHVTDSGAGINTNSAVTILSSTIANNVKDSSNKGSGINVVGGKQVTLKNTLLSGNTGGGTSANCGKTGPGAISVTSGGGNLSTDATCGLTSQSDQQNVADAKLGPLALNDNELNGTFTHALLTGSPAIDKGINDGAPSTDQRGVVRPFDALVYGQKVTDIGAYEVFFDYEDLSISGMLVLDTDRIEVGSDATVRVTVRNGSDTGEAENVVLGTVLPAGAQFKSATIDGVAGCTGTPTTVSCNLGTMAAGASSTVDMVMTFNAAGTATVSSQVVSTTPDPFPDNNSATTTVTVLTRADLAVTTTAAVSGETGADVVVTYAIANNGTGDAKNVVLNGSVPDGMTLVSVSDVALCTTSGQAFTCTIPEILADGTREFSVTVSSDTEGAYDVEATVTGDVVDPDSSNNTATATVTLTAPDTDGGGGGGCTMNPNAGFDGGLVGLLLAAFAGLGLRLRRRR